MCSQLSRCCRELEIKGSLFVASEGINIAVCGLENEINIFVSRLHEDERFTTIHFHKTYSPTLTLKKRLIKTKEELVPLDGTKVTAGQYPEQYLSPDQLKQWLDEGKAITLLDTRNAFEYELGSFDGAQQLNLNGFRELPSRQTELDALPKNQALVSFCTGGIRCEKAAPYLQEYGFNEVYQLQGGIIEYLRKFGANHWHGDCFVFDDRVSITPKLEPRHHRLCLKCQTKLSEQEGDHCMRCQSSEQPSSVETSNPENSPENGDEVI